MRLVITQIVLVASLLAASSASSVPIRPGQTVTVKDPIVLPRLRTEDGGGLVVESPGMTPPIPFRVTLDIRKMEGRELEEVLADLLGAESFEVVSYSPDLGHAEIRATEWGGFALTKDLNRRDGVVDSVSPQVDGIEGERCISILVTLPADDISPEPGEIFGPTLCPPARRVISGEHLIVVGLDVDGQSLWTTIGDNSRFYRFEDLGPAGARVQIGEHPDQTYVSTLVVPTLDGLAVLRWFAVALDGSLEQIGETAWSAAPSS